MTLFSTKHIVAALFTLVIVATLVLAGESSVQIGNFPPSFEDLEGNIVEPSDGGSSVNAITQVGEAVIFTAMAVDLNGDDYYFVVCKTDQISFTDEGLPACVDV